MSQTLIASDEVVAPVRRDRPPAGVDDVPTALLVQCTCPDWCERDHDRD